MGEGRVQRRSGTAANQIACCVWKEGFYFIFHVRLRSHVSICSINLYLSKFYFADSRIYNTNLRNFNYVLH